MKYIISFFIFTMFLCAGNITPAKVFTLSGNTTDFKIYKNKAYITTDAGTIEVFDLKKEEKIDSIQLEKIKNFFDEEYYPKVFGVDVIDNKLLFVSEDGQGGRNIFQIVDGKKELILNSRKKNLSIREVRYLNNKQIIIALTYSDVLLLDLKSKETLYRENYSMSTFSDMAFNEDKTKAALTCESGKVHIFDCKTGNELKVLDGANRDNVYKLDFKNNVILTAGQDREVGVYNVNTGTYERVKAEFLVYSAALSPDSTLGAFIKNENNELAIIDTTTLKELYILKGHKSTVNTIYFRNNNEIYSSSDDKNFIKWIIK